MKKSFLAGMIILLPIAITIWIINFFFQLLTHPFLFIAKSVLNDCGLFADDHPIWLFIARIGILIALVIVTLILGFIGQKFVFNYLINQFRKILNKIPIVKTIYQVSHQTLESLFKQTKNPFSKVVTFSFPNQETKTIAFLTGDSTKRITDKHPELDQAIFVPTAPHPVSGFLLFAPKNSITPIEITPEEAFKILFSCGSYDPNDDKNHV